MCLDSEDRSVMSYAEFEKTCQVLRNQSAYEQADLGTHTQDELHSRNLELAAQCVMSGLPQKIVYIIYCRVCTQICSRKKNSYSLTDALEILSDMYSRYAALLQEALPSSHAYPEIVERAMTLLDEAFRQDPIPKDLGVQQLAKQINVSPNYLSKCFAKEAGVTLTVFVTRRRLRRAGFLLLNTTLSVTEIAERVGFADAAYYSTVCKRITGLSPLQYRERQKLSRQQALETATEETKI